MRLSPRGGGGGALLVAACAAARRMRRTRQQFEPHAARQLDGDRPQRYY
jgi:hypothetical protein